jgi:predicted phosphodiesterase
VNHSKVQLDQKPFVAISDIHADPRAMEAVLAEAIGAKADCYRCFLGDAIGYGHDPIGVLRLLRNFDVCIRGNHEALALGEIDGVLFSGRARESILHHSAQLATENVQMLSAFFTYYASGRIILFHATPSNPFDYIFNEVDVRRVIETHSRYDLFIGGHLHAPRLAIYNKKSGDIDFREIAMPHSQFSLDLKTNKYLVTCPSTTPGRMGYTMPGCCRISHESEYKKTLEFVFTDKTEQPSRAAARETESASGRIIKG